MIFISCSDPDSLSQDDARTIRGAMMGLVKLYVVKEITFKELTHLLNFLTAVQNENLVSKLKKKNITKHS